jgi:polyhydroxybutyrate depolymerase
LRMKQRDTLLGIGLYGWVVLSLLLTGCGGVSQAQESTVANKNAKMTPKIANGCGKDSEVKAGDSEDETMTADPRVANGNSMRDYYIHVPTSYNKTQSIPLVLVFHGTGARGSDMEQVTGLSQLADQENFIVAYPQGLKDNNGQTFWASIGTTQQGIDEIRYVDDLLDNLEQSFCIDEQRIYATGFSNGGGMSWYLACNLSERIAAFAPVSGNFYDLDTGCNIKRGVPILDVHGTGDTVVPYMGGPAPEKPDLPLPSVPQWLNEWAKRDHCAQGPNTFFQNGNVTGEEWIRCRDGSSIVHYRIEGGGHAWPASLDGSPSASETIWNFFKQHPLTYS